jgi:uncharacterized protein (TIGR02099 family)
MDFRGQLQHAYRLLLAVTAMVCVAVVLLASTVFFVLQNVDQYRGELAGKIGRLLGQPVSISSAQVTWDGPNPVLQVQNLRVFDAQGGQAVGFDAAELHINVVDTLRHRALQVHGVRVVGATIEVVRRTDGQFDLVGIGTKASDASFNPAVVATLLAGPTSLTLSAAKLLFRPTQDATQTVEFAFDVDIARTAKGRSARGALRLPGRSQSYVALKGTFETATDQSGWVATVDLSSPGVALREVQALVTALPIPGVGATAEFALRVALGAQSSPRIEGTVAVRGMNWAAAPYSGPQTMSAEIAATVRGGSWRLEGRELKALGAVHQWKAERFTLNADGGGQYAATLSHGRLEDLLAMLAFVKPDDDDVEQLRNFNATGHVERFVVDWREIGAKRLPLTLTAQLRDLTWPESTRRWGVQALSGGLSMTHERGKLVVDAPDIRISAKELSAQPLRFAKASGIVEFDIADQEVVYHTNDFVFSDAQLGLSVSGTIIDDEREEDLLDLQVNARRINLVALRPYLPSPSLGNALSEWLSGNVLSGQMTDLVMDVRGRSASLDAASNADAVALRFKFANLAFNHTASLPPYQGVKGSFELRGGRASAHATEGKMGRLTASMDALVSNVAASDATLDVTSTFTGDAQTFVELFKRSQKDYAAALKGVSASGKVRAVTNVQSALNSDQRELNAQLELNKNRLQVSGVATKLTDLTGNLNFRGGNLTTNDLSIEIEGERFKLNGQYKLAGATRDGNFSLKGTTTAQYWLNLAAKLTERPPPTEQWLDRISGKSQWTLGVKLHDKDPTQLSLTSSLAGISVELPAMFAKSRRSESPFSASIALHPDAPLQLGYGEFARAAIALPSTAEAVAGISAVLGDGDVPPLAMGRWRIKGYVPRFDVSELHSVHSDQLGTDVDLSPVELDLEVGSLLIGAAQFDRVRFTLGGVNNSTLFVDSRALAGRVSAPTKVGGPVLVELERLELPALKESDGDGTLDPRTLPALSFSAKSLAYDGRRLGTLKFVSRRLADGIALDKIYLIASGFDAEGDASWRRIGSGDLTSLKASVHANDLGTLLHAVGHRGGATEGGATQVDVEASWHTFPAAVSLATMTGEVGFQSSNGRLLDLAPGPGARIFGLLNLQSLPQLVSLDFSSMFKKGFSYDRIYGRFGVEGGHAYTNDLVVENQTARINVAGRTGLVDEDYNQRVTVTPRLTDSLPLAGAALGGVGAGVGAAIWLAEKLLDTKIVDEVASFSYQVTGPWSAPVVKRLVASPDDSNDS